jgi:hypothetical protein
MKDGGSAFPSQTISHYQMGKKGAEPVYESTGGMTLRDHFAGIALIGIMGQDHVDGYGDAERLTKLAYKYADAMLAEREK